MDSATLISLRLSKDGFGSVESILATPTDLVLAMLEYGTFSADYEETMIELNRAH